MHNHKNQENKAKAIAITKEEDKGLIEGLKSMDPAFYFILGVLVSMFIEVIDYVLF